MRIGIFDPYLDTLGGGEKYILDIATYLSQKNDVYLFWNPSDKDNIQKGALNRFQIDLKNIPFIPNIFNQKISIKEKYNKTSSYDVILFVSDGSIPLLFAKRNILLIQYPIEWVKPSFVDNLKMMKISNVICYSEFVKGYLDKKLKVSALVIPPAVVNYFNPNQKKEKIILSVGRFTQHMNAKKQDKLIDAFRSIAKEIPGWELILAGGLRKEDNEYFETLKKKAYGFRIKLLANISHTELKSLYNNASLYWHATGYGEDIQKHPELTEHFGITTVEAMSAGTVPIVINSGGQKEIVTDGVNGILWDSIKELEDKTIRLAKDEKIWYKLSKNAIERAKDFAVNAFYDRVEALIAQ